MKVIKKYTSNEWTSEITQNSLTNFQHLKNFQTIKILNLLEKAAKNNKIAVTKTETTQEM